jgi:LacI family transcriptional regulator
VDLDLELGSAEWIHRRRGVARNSFAALQLAWMTCTNLSGKTNGVAFVSKGATKRIERSLEELGPSPVIRAGAPSAKRRLVGLLLSSETEPHLSEAVASFQEAAWASDYDVLTYSIRNQKQQAMPFLRMLLEWRVDAIASLIRDPGPDLIEALSSVDVPVVCFDGIPALRKGASLSIDYRNGIREGVQHLALLGHREIAFIGCTPECRSMKPKLDAFLHSLKEIGCTPKSGWLIETDGSFAGGMTGMQRLLELSPRPTAVMCSADALTLGALFALGQTRTSVPEEVSLICIDNCRFCDLIVPPITTVQLPLDEFAGTMVDAVKRLIEDPRGHIPKTALRVQTSLIVRGSTSYPFGRALPRID